MTSIEKFEKRIGDLSVISLRQGGEELFERVSGALGPALRHLERIRTGVLPFTPSVEFEIKRSLERAEKEIADAIKRSLERAEKEIADASIQPE